jgi:hypothetical protein
VKWIRLVRTTCKWRASLNALIRFNTTVLLFMTPCSLAYLVSTRRRNTLLPFSAEIEKSQILCIIEILVSIKASNSLSIWAIVSFSRRILFYGFKYKNTHTHTRHTYTDMFQQPEANNNQPDIQLHVQLTANEVAYCLMVKTFLCLYTCVLDTRMNMLRIRSCV